jgi:NADPH:quinone reductase-like Zn-dependent oxidoreductase
VTPTPPHTREVLIHGAAGGVGSAAVLLAHALEAHSVFTASGKERLARVTALGGTVGVDYRKEDFWLRSWRRPMDSTWTW